MRINSNLMLMAAMAIVGVGSSQAITMTLQPPLSTFPSLKPSERGRSLSERKDGTIKNKQGKEYKRFKDGSLRKVK
jgi:hypothetical protein